MLNAFKKNLALSLLGLAITIGLQSPAQSETLDLLRAIPLEISGYPAASSIPEHFTTADQVMGILNSDPNQLIHMEVLRRAHFDLSATEREALLAKLLARHRQAENDRARFFDYGYAQMVLSQNKTGLFFLRKANDHFQNQFTALAYAMAQAEADLIHENSTPEVLTTRKMDVVYKLKDALKYDREHHQPGFWPTYIRVVQKLDPMPAYHDFTETDFSTYYVPYGNSDLSSQISASGVNYLATADGASATYSEGACETTSVSPTDRAEMTQLYSSGQIDFNHSGQAKTLQFYRRDTSPEYRLVVSDGGRNTLLNLLTPVGPYVVEDLEGDGIFEIVIRQYAFDQLNPIVVYRLADCGFKKDKNIDALFH